MKNFLKENLLCKKPIENFQKLHSTKIKSKWIPRQRGFLEKQLVWQKMKVLFKDG